MEEAEDRDGHSSRLLVVHYLFSYWEFIQSITNVVKSIIELGAMKPEVGRL